MIFCSISAPGDPSKQVLTCLGCSLLSFTFAFSFFVCFA
jgi:hypothetical protein